jgi:hypothetical protein
MDTNHHTKQTICSLFKKRNKNGIEKVDECTMGLITGFRPSKNINTSVALRFNKSISKSKNRNCLSVTSVQPKASKHLKTPRKGKYQNIRLHAKRQKLKHDQYFKDMKIHHYEHFVKSFTKDLKGTRVELEDGEAEEIMRDYIFNKRVTDKPSKMALALMGPKEIVTNKRFLSRKLSFKDHSADYSSNYNSSSTKATNLKNTKRRLRPKTVSKLRARNQTKLYTINEDSALVNFKNNQKSTANTRVDDIASITNDELNISLVETSKYSSAHKPYARMSTSPAKRIRRKLIQEEEIFPIKYVHPDTIKALAGKSDGVLNAFNKKKGLRELNSLLKGFVLYIYNYRFLI